MKVFTYGQYIKCIHTLRLNAVMQLAEESVNYNLNQVEKKYSHDKLIKDILQDEEEATQFINQFVIPRQKVKKEELIRYTNSYITKKYKSKEADLVYKLKSQDIFFLIEHQSTIDYNMPYRMLNYCLDIMQEWSRNKKIGKNTSYPIIVPIIIYTGSEKWRMPRSFREKQIGEYVLERYEIELEYNFIDINKLPRQMLLQRNSMFSYIMFLEKAQSSEELVENLEIIIQSTQNRKILEEFVNIISYLLENTLEEKIQQKLLEKIERKVGKKDMDRLESLVNKMRTENNRRIRRESQKEIAKNMMSIKLDEKIILQTTKIKEEELEKIKEELATAG